MAHRGNKFAAIVLLIAALGVGGTIAYREYSKDCCSGSDRAEPAPKERLGLMTSLPLYWPLGMDFPELVSANGAMPQQRDLLEMRFELAPLDTLSPIPALSADQPDTDPLAGLDRIAVIQPRGLSPADNVALDEWVRKGGHLLLVLDPMLTGEYDLPLGDPRRPVDTALIPPIVERWGLTITFRVHEKWDNGLRKVMLGKSAFTVAHGGDIEIIERNDAVCQLHADAVIAQCDIAEGRVTLMVDAAMFENIEFAGKNGENIYALMDFAFE